ncbi:hypothetical protein [Nonomuraea typhae]|uniref:Integral membrane protein n=1 Tax=Nonomuraea typhae TaxID=2603600 RepID=A0ABW7ZCU9_9ACTN
MFLRVVIMLQTIAVFVQAITAGVMLSSPHGGALHSAGSYTLFVVVVVHVIAAVLAWRPGGGPARPIWLALGFLVLVSAQVAVGLAGVAVVHVPLGMLLFGLSVLHLVRIWATTGRQAAPVPGGSAV